jgi:hypothetical protein
MIEENENEKEYREAFININEENPQAIALSEEYKKHYPKAGRPPEFLKVTEQRREYVWEMMKQRGIHNFPAKELAEMWRVEVPIIYADIKINLDKMPLPLVDQEAKGLLLVYKRAINQAFKLIETTIPAKFELPQKLPNETDKEYLIRSRNSEKRFYRDKEIALKRISDGIAKLILVGDSYTKFLENFGFKEKIASKLEVREISMKRIDHVLRRAEDAGRRIFTSEDVAIEQE